MSEEYNYKDSFLHHRNSQNKFDYFFLGIIITSLSFSIQTFDNSKTYENIYLIILSWFLLFVSFFSGVFRQEKLNSFFLNESNKLGKEKEKKFYESGIKGEINLLKSEDEVWTKEDYEKILTNISELINISDFFINKFLKNSSIAYQIQKWSFFYAALCYIFFKISNVFYISSNFMIIFLILSIILNIAIIKIYKKYLKYEIKK